MKSQEATPQNLRRWLWTVCIVAGIIAFFTASVSAQNRFPRPDFQSGYTQPQTIFPPSRPAVLDYLDVAALFAALSCAAYFALRRRSRTAIFLTMIISIGWFGFYRKGCICSVGAIQNVTASLFDPTLVIPVSVVLFFVLPLLFALLFGRVFCAAVCPLGGVQDLVALRPKQLPVWAESILKLLPHVYLGAAVLFVGTGTGFIICKFDPIVGIFRHSASVGMVAWSGVFLLAGIFIARPYCRFLCPYGVLLGWMSTLAKWHTAITPDECVKCRLCTDSCPFGAIQAPTTLPDEPKPRSLKRMLLNCALVPAWILGGAIAGYFAHGTLAHLHPLVRLSGRINLEEQLKNPGASIETQTFRTGTLPVATLTARAEVIKRKFLIGSIILGCYLGLVIGVMLLRRSLLRTREDFTPDRSNCLSCGRCFRSCPKEQVRIKQLRAKKVLR